ncbi:glycosyltransferase family 2 protein [Methylobacter svalbardensis]|uniref:glycosyltransferase family 2 protein n=1 Tax=Methylobacter svalbardensis TaxID=3080016 RepID=UPI0030EEA55A
MIKLSIIIPVYNTEKYVSRCLNSCLNQTADQENYEIIVINDGSTDNSLDIVRDFEQKNKNVTVISQKNQKQGTARNNGVKLAKGKYIWFIDSDDWIEPNAISEIVKYLYIHNLDILRFDGADRRTYNDTAQIRSCHHIPHQIYYQHEVLLENKFSVCVPFHVYKKDFLLDNEIYFLENIFYEDNEFMLKIFEKSSSFSYLNKCFYNVLIREDSTTRSVDYSRKLDYIRVIESYIEYIKTNNLKPEVQHIFEIHIARCMNSALCGTTKSPDVFNKAIELLSNLKYLYFHVKCSKSYFHILEFHFMKYPKILRKLLLMHYNN